MLHHYRHSILLKENKVIYHLYHMPSHMLLALALALRRPHRRQNRMLRLE